MTEGGESNGSVDWTSWSRVPDGWRDLDRWVDLTHPLTDQLPYPQYFQAPCIHRVMSLPGDPINLTRLEMMCHYGTHIDAPNHLIENAPSVDQIPFHKLWGPGVVWRFGVPDDGLLTSTDFEKAIPPAHPGDIVIVDTGWSDLIHDRRYAHHPSLSTDAAQWLVDERIALVGFDFLTPDLPVLRRPPNFRMPIHLIILGGGVLIIENVKTSPELAGRRVEVMVQPLPLVGADGSPVRLWARALRNAEEQGSRPEGF